VSADAAADAMISTLEHFVRTLGIKNVGPSTVEKLVRQGGVRSVADFIALKEEPIKPIVGVSAAGKVVNGIREARQSCSYVEWMAASNLFGRGVGKSRLQAIVDKYPEVFAADGIHLEARPNEQREVPGVGQKTVDQVFDALPEFIAQVGADPIGAQAPRPAPVAAPGATAAPGAPGAAGSTRTTPGMSMAGQQVLFTGFRNKELEAAVVAAGGVIASSMSKKVTLLVAKDITEDSGKLKQARELQAKGAPLVIMSLADFEKQMR